VNEWYHDLIRAFRYAMPDQLTESGELPDALYRPLTALFGPSAEKDTFEKVDLVFAVECGGEPAFLIVGDDAWLARFEEPNVSEITFLGDLAGGSYTERMTVGPKDDEIEGTFLHRRLGREKTLRLKLKKPHPQPGLYPSDETDFLVSRGDQLRQKFREWSRHDVSDPGVT
jgi:hypothetical protein